MRRMVFSLVSAGKRSEAGSKARNLLFLHSRGYRIPETYVIPYPADRDPELLKKELGKVVKPAIKYAVRSSADVEDSPDLSFAGQFRSILDVSGVEMIADAVSEICRDAASSDNLVYGHKKTATEVRMGIVLQEMTDTSFSGIAFSKNPVTGMSETIVEGTAGRFIDQPVSPEHWVLKQGVILSKPDNPVIPQKLIHTIEETVIKAAQEYGRPADIEWASDGNTLVLLQIRPITCLGSDIYSNRISKEMLPGVIKPLVWSVNTQINNERWKYILCRIAGRGAVRAESLTAHMYYHAYFNMGEFGRIFERFGMPADMLEQMMGVKAAGKDTHRPKPGPEAMLRLPGIISFLTSLLFIRHKLKRTALIRDARFRTLAGKLPEETDPARLLDAASEMMHEMREVVHFNILIPLLAAVNSHILAGMLKKSGADLTLTAISGVNSVTDEYSPHANLRRLHLKHYTGDPGPDKKALDADIGLFLEKFGHYSDSGNDFSSVPWNETPSLIFSMLENMGSSPKTHEEEKPLKTLQLPYIRRSLVSYFLKKTSQFAVSREQASALYTFCYGKFRTCFLSLARILVTNGALENTDDIFWLYLPEVKELTVSAGSIPQLHELIDKRRTEAEKYRHVDLPETIFGKPGPLVFESHGSKQLGMPVSPGIYTGKVKVLRGLSEFSKLSEGDVLVIPYSDTGWTPLFSKAGAVIAESGGLLSHSAIVAREYRIPAVVSVPGACGMADGTLVTVNGSTGEIFILEDQ